MKKFIVLTVLIVLVVAGSAKAEELAWVQGVDSGKNLVEIQAIRIKINILISFADIRSLALSLNGVTSFNFMCTQDIEGNCDFTQPFRIRIRDSIGDVLAWEFVSPPEEIFIYEGKEWSALARVRVGEKYILFALNNPEDDALKKALGKNCDLSVEILEIFPSLIYLNEVPFSVIGVAIENEKIEPRKPTFLIWMVNQHIWKDS